MWHCIGKRTNRLISCCARKYREIKLSNVNFELVYNREPNNLLQMKEKQGNG